MQSSVYQRPPRRTGSPASFFRRQAQVFPSALRRADCLSVASFCPLAGGSTGVAGKTRPEDLRVEALQCGKLYY